MNFNLLDFHTSQELLTMYDTITKQSYYTNKDNIIIQNDRLTMDTPSSGILSEVPLQYVVSSHFARITKKLKLC
jgi:hypothetical protein